MSLNQARKSAAADTSDEEKVAMAQPASRNPTDPRAIQDVFKKSYEAQRSARIDAGLAEKRIDAGLAEKRIDAGLAEKRIDAELQAKKMKIDAELQAQRIDA